MPLRKVVGPLVMMLTLPPFVYYVWICLRYGGGALVLPTSTREWLDLAATVPAPTLTAVLLVGGWFLLQAVLQLVAPGSVREGTPLADGSRLRYRMNGWFSFWFSLAVVVLVAAAGWVLPTIVYDQFGQLLTTMNLVAFLGSVYLHLHGRARERAPTGRDRAPRGRDRAPLGNVVYDYVMGVSLNPRLGDFDFKFFCESRPGLILWIVFDLSLAATQYELHGRVTTPMILVLAFQLLYVADYFFHEDAILTTWDIKHERFGWMLCWGDLVWVPFTFTLQAYYLVDHPHELPTLATIGIVALNMFGYVVFRASNIQKHRFRRDPERPVWGKKPEYIRTAQGGLLLTSGWWGIARHLNYGGDLCMALAWCLPTGFAHPLPYLYFVYMATLLVHRERRDHTVCAEKYGSDWDTYCRKVPWRIVPGVY